MDEDQYLALKETLEDVGDHKSLYLLFCEGFVLEDAPDTAEKKAGLQHVLRRLAICIENSEKTFYNVRKMMHAPRKAAPKTPVPPAPRDPPPSIFTSMFSVFGHPGQNRGRTDNAKHSPDGRSNTNNNANNNKSDSGPGEKRKRATNHDRDTLHFSDDDDDTSEEIANKAVHAEGLADSSKKSGSGDKMPQSSRMAFMDTAGSEDSEGAARTMPESRGNVPRGAAPGRGVNDDAHDVRERGQTSPEGSAAEDDVIDASDMRHAYFLEMRCFASLETILEGYWMSNANYLMEKFVYLSIADKKFKNAYLFDEVFMIICRCKCILALWQSLHRPEIYSIRATDFAFAVKYHLCCSDKPILEYSVKDIVCAIQTLSEVWIDIIYCHDIANYIDLLMMRTATFICYTSDGTEHNMIRYRTVVAKAKDEDPAKMICASNQTFVIEMASYFYSYRKAMKMRDVFNTVTAYDLNLLFNQKHSYRVISCLGVDTSKSFLHDDRLQSIKYETSIYSTTANNNNNNNNNAAMRSHGPERSMESETMSHVPQQHQSMGHQSEAEPPPMDDPQMQSIRDLYQDQLSFELTTMNQLRVCYFLNDELIKINANKEISFRILAWMQKRTVSIKEYGEDTIRLYRKMCLSFCVMRGEDLLQYRRTVAPNQTIEAVLQAQRGIKMFNRMQESLNVDPDRVLPRLDHVFGGTIERFPAESKMATLVCTRSEAMYAELRERDERDDATAASRAPKTFSEEPRSTVYDCFPESFENKNSLHQRTNFTIFQALMGIKVIDAYFQNMYSMSFEQRFVIYDREIESQYSTYTRSRYPMLIQTFNTFQLYYNDVMYDVGNFACVFYLWMRLVDQYHGCYIDSQDIRGFYVDIFSTDRIYRELCCVSLVNMFAAPPTNTTTNNEKAPETLLPLAAPDQPADNHDEDSDDDAINLQF